MPLNNAQKLIAHIRSFLAVQDEASVDARGGCLYRGENSTRCAVGCIIPDEIYAPKMEGHSFRVVINDFPSLLEYLSNHWEIPNQLLTEILIECQLIHDLTPELGNNNHWWQDFTQLMEKYAND